METATNENARPAQPATTKCVLCGMPTARFVDGDPSCDYHANQVYENQMEDYIRQNLN